MLRQDTIDFASFNGNPSMKPVIFFKIIWNLQRFNQRSRDALGMSKALLPVSGSISYRELTGSFLVCSFLYLEDVSVI